MEFDQQIYRNYQVSNSWLNRAYRYLFKSGRKFTQPELAILANPANAVADLTPVIEILDTRFTVTNNKDWASISPAQWYFDSPLHETQFVVFDLESTGSVFGKDEIFEIGAVKMEGKEQIEEFHAYLGISQEIPLFVQKMTGVNTRLIKNAASTKQVLQDFIKFIGSSILVAHNSEFDYNFIYYQLQKDRIFTTPSLDLCTWLLAKSLIKGEKHGLSDLSEFHKGQLSNRHSAIYDAKMTAFLFQYLLSKLMDINVLYLSEVLEFEKESFKTSYSPKKRIDRFTQKSKKNRYIRVK